MGDWEVAYLCRVYCYSADGHLGDRSTWLVDAAAQGLNLEVHLDECEQRHSHRRNWPFEGNDLLFLPIVVWRTVGPRSDC